MNDEPTILSLQDTIDCIIRKYGENWRDFPDAKCIVIWSSSNFIEENVKEVVPDLFDLCLEYRTKKTINGHTLAQNFYLLAFSIFDK